MLLSVEEAKGQLEHLIELMLSGEEIFISNGEQLIQLIPARKSRFVHGILADKLSAEGMPDFLEPMSEEELQDWEGRE